MFAKKLGFDPLVAANWYPVSHDDVSAEKVCERVAGGGKLIEKSVEGRGEREREREDEDRNTIM